jgi:hypothetical protein
MYLSVVDAFFVSVKNLNRYCARKSQSFYLPLWQNYPTTQPTFGFDWLASNAMTVKSVLACVNGAQAILATPYNMPNM